MNALLLSSMHTTSTYLWHLDSSLILQNVTRLVWLRHDIYGTAMEDELHRHSFKQD